VVESPAKAKTINKYLGSGFTVVASFGHVRDLPAKDGSVRPDQDFAMDWELGDRSRKHLDEILRAVRSHRRLYLATDPDREGEAIAWHVQEVLREWHALDAVEVQRVTFNEITRSAVLAAMQAPRAVDRELVEAYLARRALDYLVGFTLSPVLWRKLPGSKSAGRVQSVALRLVCEREAEIEAFRSQEYWTVEADLVTADGATVTARLFQLDGRKLERLEIGDRGAAEAAAARIRAAALSVTTVERRQVRRHPAPPFTTSTLQQEASRKLGLSASRTMRIAQRLYEGVDLGGETVGLITYMRTDGVQISKEAIDAVRRLITDGYGPPYLPPAPRVYKTQAKNAQEAHEAIRPTDMHRRPGELASCLQADELRLYELIWKRAVASQMASAEFDQVTVDIASASGDLVLRATGSVLLFDGFLRVYREDRDDDTDEDGDRRLPPLKTGNSLRCAEVRPDQHFTQPPPRYTEASLVKRLEELGIGRPSTYASILQVLQDRQYVRLEKKRFQPEDRGRLVTAFLESYFQRYVEYTFTADLENKLDDISGGRANWKEVLREFWTAFSDAIGQTQGLSIAQVIDVLDAELGPHFFPARLDDAGTPIDPRRCPACGQGRLGLKLSRNGAFIGCNRYEEKGKGCQYTRPLAVDGGAVDPSEALAEGPRELGNDPDSGLPVTLRRGPFGAYLQLGPSPVPATPKAAEAANDSEAEAKAEAESGKGKTKGKAKGKTKAKVKAAEVEKPKRVSLPKGMTPSAVTLEIGLQLLALPRELGTHPDSGEPITAGIGRFGPYLRHGSTYKSLPPEEDVLSIGINRAVVLMAETGGRGGKGTPDRALGVHPEDGKAITLGKGRFGPYVRHGKLYASLPRGAEPEDVTLEEAIELLAARAARAGEGGKAPASRAGAAKAATAAKAPRSRRTADGTKSAERPTAVGLVITAPELDADALAPKKAKKAPAKPKATTPAKRAPRKAASTRSRGDEA